MKKSIFRLIFVVLCGFAIVQPTFSQASDKPGPNGPRVNNRSIQKWVKRKNNAFVYRVNVFNLDPEHVDQKILKSIIAANVKDINSIYLKDWGLMIDVKVYKADQLSNPCLFQGDRVPFFITSESTTEGAIGFHSVESVEPAATGSFLYKDGNIKAKLGITVPSNFPAWTPYGASLDSVVQQACDDNIMNNNPYGITEFYQMLSFIINHELKELLHDDGEQNWVVFDNFAPTVAKWRYAEFDAHGVVTNGKVGKDGFVHLPLFSDVFPAGGIFTTIQENGDVVSIGIGSLLNGYKVNGWFMSNYPTQTFWYGYNKKSYLKWDKKGLVENPLQPFVGLHEGVFFLDFETGTTFFGDVRNFGPVTAPQRGAPPQNNFPPDYTFISFDFNFNPGERPEKSLAELR